MKAREIARRIAKEGCGWDVACFGSPGNETCPFARGKCGGRDGSKDFARSWLAANPETPEKAVERFEVGKWYAHPLKAEPIKCVSIKDGQAFFDTSLPDRADNPPRNNLWREVPPPERAQGHWHSVPADMTTGTPRVELTDDPYPLRGFRVEFPYPRTQERRALRARLLERI